MDIDVLRAQYDYFVYGMILSTEAFVKNDGDAGGYAALFCDWLTLLFDIPFRLEFFEAADLLDKLNAGKIDFSGNIMPNEERAKMLFMTDTIATRQFITIRSEKSERLDIISYNRPLRFAFMRDTPLEAVVASVIPRGSYVPVWVNDYSQAYQVIKNGEADAFVAASSSRIHFVDYGDVITEDLFPLIFNSVSMATAKAELVPVISVVNKALRNGGISYISELYNQGYQEYRKHKMLKLLNDEELEYISKNPIIQIAAFNTNYPLSFYNHRNQKWQGIFFDLLDEVSLLTGLSFHVAHDPNANMPVVNQMLLNRDAVVIPSLAWTKEREENFVWSEHVLLNDYFALISKSELPNASLNDIMTLSVGVARDTIHSEIFMQWFPGHTNTVVFEGFDSALLAGLRDCAKKAAGLGQ